MKYALLSPIGRSRLYALGEFFTHISSFNLQPVETVACLE